MSLAQRIRRKVFVAAAATAVLSAVGCMSAGPRLAGRQSPPICVPPPGTVPTELTSVTLPEYVIEPPDVLEITAVLRNAKDDPAAAPGAPPPKIDPDKPPEFGTTVRELPIQPIHQVFQVQQDGTVFLGVWGSVQVAGLTKAQAAQRVREALLAQLKEAKGGDTRPEALLVLVDVSQFNSKYYLVITDGGGAGETVSRFPITGKEYVTDAVANIQGLPPQASKRNIWVARRTPQLSEQQILPVDWVGISQWGVTATNYQLFPGDRVYVKAQRLVTIDTTLARIIAPIDRIFGVTLLGASTVNQIQGRGNGFGGN